MADEETLNVGALDEAAAEDSVDVPADETPEEVPLEEPIHEEGSQG